MLSGELCYWSSQHFIGFFLPLISLFQNIEALIERIWWSFRKHFHSRTLELLQLLVQLFLRGRILFRWEHWSRARLLYQVVYVHSSGWELRKFVVFLLIYVTTIECLRGVEVVYGFFKDINGYRAGVFDIRASRWFFINRGFHYHFLATYRSTLPTALT